MANHLLVDFNSVGADGYVRALISDADGPLEVGEVIEARDGEGAHCKVTVMAVVPERGIVRVLPDLSTWWNEARVSYDVDPRLGWIEEASLRITAFSMPVTGTGSVVSTHVSRHPAAC